MLNEEAGDKRAVVCRPVLGHGDAGEITIDLPRLIETKLLITATSGGGKSFAIRRILEQTAPLIQQLVIDPEGEFSTLAEKYPYIVCNSENSPIALTIDSAQSLAQELMKAGTSAILDLSEFDPEDRHLFVANFIKGLMCLPQQYWRHVLVFLDEAHLFAPQHDKSEAKKAVIDLAGRGRKRGFCLIPATQRLSKLNKNVASEIQNRLIGLTTLDVDLRRAADELGMTLSDASNLLGDLQPGEFFAYGPALSKKVQKIKIGPCSTRHGALECDIQPPNISGEETISIIQEKLRLYAQNDGEPNAESVVPQAGEKFALKTRLGKTVSSEEGPQDARSRIAQERLDALQPVLSAPYGHRKKAVVKAAKSASVSAATISLWLSKYDPSNPLESMMPLRLPSVEKTRAEKTAAVVAPAAKKHEARGEAATPRRLLSEQQRRKLKAAGIGVMHMDILEYMRGGATTVKCLAEKVNQPENTVTGCISLMKMLLRAKTTAQLVYETDAGRFAEYA